jgi:membrane protein DedA with SNARE-associated domain
MPEIVNAVVNYGYLSLFVALFLEAIGLPIPGAIALLAAGAAAETGALHPLLALLVAASAMLLADCLLYFLGRRSGWSLLSVLCGLSLSPETCILRAARWFYERGRTTLLFAKFLPGVNTMAPPLAGSMNMRAGQFLRFDVAGASAYILAYGALGFLFHGMFQWIAGKVQAFSVVVGWVVLAGFAAFIANRAWYYLRHRAHRSIRRASVKEIADRLSGGNPSPIVIADVRSHGYYDPDEQRVRGSIRIEPNNLEAAIDTLPRDRPIYLYCT